MRARGKLLWPLVMLVGLLSASAAEPASVEQAPAPATRVAPEYPAAAAAAGREGVVEVYVSIEPDGTVTSVQTASETPAGYGFAEAALKAVAQWTFKPKGARGTYRVKVKFSLDRPSATADVDMPPGIPVAPRAVHRVRPNYPASAAYRNESGIVVLIIEIDADGTVTSARTYSERPRNLGFDKAAIKAVKKSRFPKGVAGTYALKVYFGIAESEETYEAERNAPEAPEPTLRIEPIYPPKARASGLSGDVWVALQIGEGGRVVDARAVVEKPKYEGFGEAAVAAVRQWRFDPSVAPGTYKTTIAFQP
ncbi:MAG: TonB family protein [Alphaproteobacteria bacterium]|nr:TonB family protein [Alphaproteobacteria bacterium]